MMNIANGAISSPTAASKKTERPIYSSNPPASNNYTPSEVNQPKKKEETETKSGYDQPVSPKSQSSYLK